MQSCSRHDRRRHASKPATVRCYFGTRHSQTGGRLLADYSSTEVRFNRTSPRNITNLPEIGIFATLLHSETVGQRCPARSVLVSCRFKILQPEIRRESYSNRQVPADFPTSRCGCVNNKPPFSFAHRACSPIYDYGGYVSFVLIRPSKRCEWRKCTKNSMA